MRVYENRQCNFFSLSDNLHAILSEKMRKNRGIAPENDLCTIPPSFLIGSSSFLQVTRTIIKSRISLNFGQIGPQTAELAALEHLEKFP